VQKGRLIRSAGIPAVLLAFSLVLLPVPRASAQVQAAPIVVGWAELASRDPASTYSNAAVLVPRQLMTALSFVKLRYQGKESTDLVLRKASEFELEAAKKAVASARAARDLKALSIQDPARRAAELLTADAAVANAEAALNLVLENAAGTVAESPETANEVQPEPAPASLVRWAEHASGTLLSVVEDPAAVCAEKKLDLLLYGSIQPRGTSLAIELVLYDAVLGRAVWQTTDYAFPDGLADVVVSFIRPLAEAMLGRTYSLVEFRVDPPVANLYLDGAVYTDSEILYFEPRTHEARARAEGFEEASSVFLAEPGFDTVITMRLEEKPSVGLTLSSDPVGAVVHIDGTRAGVAPLDLSGAAYPRVARLSLPGYEDAQLVLRPQSIDDQLIIPLAVSDGLTFDNRFDERKGTFYRSLGWFIASLPLTVLSGGLFQSYYKTAEAYEALADNEKEASVIEQLNTGFVVSQTTFWAAAALSAGLMANAIFRLVLYIGSAQ